MNTHRKKAEVVALPAAEPQAKIDSALVGQLVAYEHGEPRVDFPGNTRGPLPARVSAALDAPTLAVAAKSRQDALLFFESGDPARPVIVSLLRSSTPLVDLLLDRALPLSQDVVHVDGARVSIEGKEEIVLRCGKASLTLRRDGRAILRGVNVVTQADQVQKIRGGKVQIN